ncbi:MAG: biopolymer transporter ExbD [Kofleriaceae bacterium]|nr:biopolymer transporter ExbD [Kofleriaceae bacterium]MBP6836505.1 biopolymer transporter ExbD [Kofleriaceae bacterium]MBP9207525.1 biopolymer transporter ExbD [Kofleriaceae bacterium]
MSTGKKGSGMSEINITPLVDVVLVLLIIFLVTMPILMKQVTLEVPRKIEDNEIVAPDNAKQLAILVKADMSIVFNDGDKETSIQAIDLATTLRPLLDAKKGEKVVFVDFEDPVRWADTISIMDTIRSIASDPNHNEIKAALKVRELAAPQ